jgi:hypothetical protein
VFPTLVTLICPEIVRIDLPAGVASEAARVLVAPDKPTPAPAKQKIRLEIIGHTWSWVVPRYCSRNLNETLMLGRLAE